MYWKSKGRQPANDFSSAVEIQYEALKVVQFFYSMEETEDTGSIMEP